MSNEQCKIRGEKGALALFHGCIIKEQLTISNI